MNIIKKLLFYFYFLTLTLFVYLNKGVAYTYLVEILWLIGIIFIFYIRRQYRILLSIRIKILILFIFLSIIYLTLAIGKYSFTKILQDAFIFLYPIFIFIIFIFKEEIDFIWKILFDIYKILPIVLFLNFILQYFVPFLDNFSLFGSIPILLYKNGDMGVHLCISSIFMILNINNIKKNEFYILLFFIIYDFLILSSYSRSGMLSYLLGLICFYYFTNNLEIKSSFKVFAKYIPFLLIIIIPLFITLKVKENFQGRVAGIEQISQNFTSIFGQAEADNLENNEIWRLIWWTKIIDYSFTTNSFFYGKGLGMSLAQTDDITADDDLRSPHNFHLTIMARFGVIVFFIWVYWMILTLKPLFSKKLTPKMLALTCIIFAFLFNSSFDVFLEGPMGAFPFWTFVGLLYIEEFNERKITKDLEIGPA
jgi:hypothetical protein